MILPTLKPLHRFLVITAAIVFIIGSLSLLDIKTPTNLSIPRPYRAKQPIHHEPEPELEEDEFDEYEEYPTFVEDAKPKHEAEHTTHTTHNTHTTTTTTQKPWWFVATMSPSWGFQRRAMIRATWQRLFRDDNVFKMRFIISNTTELWREVVKFENDTFGDLVQLSELVEENRVANTVKSIHLFKWLQQQGEHYPWISKVDDDSFIDVPNFLKEYLIPMTDLTAHPVRSTVNRTMIGRKTWLGPVPYPAGQFYTMTWDVAVLLSELWDKEPFDNRHEDELNGKLLMDFDEKVNIIDLTNARAYDYTGDKARGDGTAWANENDLEQLHLWQHAVGPGTINVHRLKIDQTYMEVASCFDKDGVIWPPPGVAKEAAEKKEKEDKEKAEEDAWLAEEQRKEEERKQKEEEEKARLLQEEEAAKKEEQLWEEKQKEAS